MAPEADVTHSTHVSVPPHVYLEDQDVSGQLLDSIADQYASEELERRRAHTERSIATAQEQATT